jgi:hypothetical protein
MRAVLVKGGGDDALPVWRIRSRPDAVAMAGEDGELLGRARVPDTRGLVGRGGNDALPVGRETRAVRDRLVMAKYGELPARGSAPRFARSLSFEAVTMRRPSGEKRGAAHVCDVVFVGGETFAMA